LNRQDVEGNLEEEWIKLFRLLGYMKNCELGEA